MDSVRELHRIKEEFNQAIRRVNQVPGLEICLEVLEVKAESGLPTVTGVEVSVKMEIYP
jgi:hypothetical protein